MQHALQKLIRKIKDRIDELENNLVNDLVDENASRVDSLMRIEKLKTHLRELEKGIDE